MSLPRSFYRALLWITLALPSALFARAEIDFNDGWRFSVGNPPDANQAEFDDSTWTLLRLPHDWAAAGPFQADGDGDTGKLPWWGDGWYRKQFTPDASLAGKRLILVFDGVMASPTVFVNGALAGQWDYGYNSFTVDITPFVTPGDRNTIAVHATTTRMNSRWYPGAGIYRKVTLVALDPIHVAIWGTFVSTPEVAETWADVRALTDIRNDSDSSAEILVTETVVSPAGGVVAESEKRLLVAANSTEKLETWTTLARPQRWDIDSPQRYTLVTTLAKDGVELDRYETKFGIRTFEFTADDGFWLNGRRVQLFGVNLHHDQGPLGAVLLPRALERQLEIMKEMGVNAIRSSHNVPAPELPELCDRMGLILIDELFDKWDATAGFDPETMDFDKFFERQVSNFVRRDRNHPSIVLWSVGNEIRDVQGNRDFGLERLKKVTGYFSDYDPTRPTTMVCDVTSSVRFRHFDLYNVHSWNYGRRYLPARAAAPDKAVIISESASTVSTRGYYDAKLPQTKTDFRESPPYQVSSYDLNAPAWAEPADDDFMWQEEDGYVAGEFIWTGFDYIGEPTPYNNDWARQTKRPQTDVSRSSYFGVVDLCGFPKDRFYLYRSYWRPDETTIHLLPHWNWPGHEGQVVPVFAYTNGDKAELFLNGKSLGWREKKPKSGNSTERYRLMWNDVVYEPGELRVVAYKDGIKLGEAVVQTAGKPKSLALAADREAIKADGDDIVYLTVEARDEQNRFCPLAENSVSITLSGPATLAGVDNGNPRSLVSFQSREIPLFHGKALVVLRSRKDMKGQIKVTVESGDLSATSLTVESR